MTPPPTPPPISSQNIENKRQFFGTLRKKLNPKELEPKYSFARTYIAKSPLLWRLERTGGNKPIVNSTRTGRGQPVHGPSDLSKNSGSLPEPNAGPSLGYADPNGSISSIVTAVNVTKVVAQSRLGVA